jgi:hypothetical protein
MTMKGKNEKVTAAQQNFERLNDALEQSVDFHQEVDRIISSTISPVEGIFDRASTGIPTLTNQLDYSWGDVTDLEEGGGNLGSIQYKHRSSLTNSTGTLPISNQQQHAGRGVGVEGGGVGKKKRILQPGEVEMQGYRRRQLTTMLVYIAYLLSVGIVYILQRWLPMVFFRFQHRRVGLTLASKVVVKSSDNKKEVCPVSLCEDNATPMIFYRFLPYVYSHEKMTFEPLHFNINLPYHELHRRYQQGNSSSDTYRIIPSKSLALPRSLSSSSPSHSLLPAISPSLFSTLISPPLSSRT